MSKCRILGLYAVCSTPCVGPDCQEPITSMAMDGKAVWASAGSDVIKYLRGKEVARVSNPFGSTISFILIFGTQLLALTEDGKRMIIWGTGDNGASSGRLHLSLTNLYLKTCSPRWNLSLASPQQLSCTLPHT